MRDIALGLALKFHETRQADIEAVFATAEKIGAFLSGGEAPAAEQPELAKPATTRKKSTDKSANDSDTSNKQTLEPVTPATVDAGSATTASDASSITTTGTTAAPLEITRDAMLAEATSYSQKHDLAVVLGKLGAERFSAVPAERYPEFMALLTEGASSGNALS